MNVRSVTAVAISLILHTAMDENESTKEILVEAQ